MRALPMYPIWHSTSSELAAGQLYVRMGRLDLPTSTTSLQGRPAFTTSTVKGTGDVCYDCGGFAL